MASKRNPAWRLEVTHFKAVGDTVILVMFTTSVSGTLFASANDQEKKSDFWIPKELRFRERPSHRLQQVFGVRPQRFPPGLGPSCPVRGAGHRLGRPWAAVLGRDSMSGNLLFPDDEPETDTDGTFRTCDQSVRSGGWECWRLTSMRKTRILWDRLYSCRMKHNIHLCYMWKLTIADSS